MKTLVAFFSHKGETYLAGAIRSLKVGNAETIATKIKALKNAEIFEIQTQKIYPENYQACCNEAMLETKRGEFPALARELANAESFDEIVLVYPCWWGTMPRAVMTFLKTYDFAGKTIYPVCTHEGSGMGSSEKDLRALCPNANIKEGLAIQGGLAGGCDKQLKKYFKNQGKN